MDVKGQVERLEKARKTIQQFTTEKSRLEGQLSTLTNHREELSKRCREQFECDIEDTTELKRQFDEEAEQALANAEVILGLREGELKLLPTQEPVSVPKAAPTKAAPVKTVKRLASVPAEDEDSILG